METDGPAVAALLAHGFRCRESFWLTALSHLAGHDGPDGLPRFGYVLEVSGTLVGVILLIFARIEEGATSRIQCSLSSWYVDPLYRSFAVMLVSRALAHKGVTYVNLTPAPQTVPILKAQGYREFCTGKFVALPLLASAGRSLPVHVICNSGSVPRELPEYDSRLLRAHAAFGCLSLACIRNGRAHPFVFALRRRHGIPMTALLIYCRHLDELALCAGALGRFFAQRGFFVLTLHARGAVPGLPGFFRRSTPTFYFGAEPPRPGNLAWSECAMFGV